MDQQAVSALVRLPPELWRAILLYLHPSYLQLIARRVSRMWDQVIRDVMPLSLLRNVKLSVSFGSTIYARPGPSEILPGKGYSAGTLIFGPSGGQTLPPNLFNSMFDQITHYFVGFKHNLWRGILPHTQEQRYILGTLEYLQQGIGVTVRVRWEDGTFRKLHYTILEDRDRRLRIRVDRVEVNVRALLSWTGAQRIDMSRIDLWKTRAQIEEGKRRAEEMERGQKAAEERRIQKKAVRLARLCLPCIWKRKAT
ncbi:hypothetical protein DFJ77DRAFT_476498 [Powellomyces hirtus]|nr:hypothetical protein DFJ77DRAFT_476498 [Powellomyces hirtus]